MLKIDVTKRVAKAHINANAPDLMHELYMCVNGDVLPVDNTVLDCNYRAQFPNDSAENNTDCRLNDSLLRFCFRLCCQRISVGTIFR